MAWRARSRARGTLDLLRPCPDADIFAHAANSVSESTWRDGSWLEKSAATAKTYLHRHKNPAPARSSNRSFSRRPDPTTNPRV